jgi:hypothetical protein
MRRKVAIKVKKIYYLLMRRKVAILTVATSHHYV